MMIWNNPTPLTFTHLRFQSREKEQPSGLYDGCWMDGFIVSRFVKRKPFDESKVLYVQCVEAQAVAQGSCGDQGIGKVEPVAQGIRFKQGQGKFRCFLVNGDLAQTGKMFFDLQQFAPISRSKIQLAASDDTHSEIGQANLLQC